MINIEEIITKKLKEVDVVIGGSRDPLTKIYYRC